MAMQIDRDALKNLVIPVAQDVFPDAEFARRPLMDAVEARVRADGVWTADDDDPSESTGHKSKGLATIDWAISDLKQDGRLENPEHNRWRLPPE
jgi:hypothetical protein